MANKKKKNRKREVPGVEPFEDDTVNDDESEDDTEDEIENEEDNVAKESAKKRKKDEDEEELEVEDDAEDDDEDDEDDEDEVEAPVGFAPYIIHEEMEWDLEDVVDNAEPGEDIYFYRAPTEDSPTAKWFKLGSVNVGEIPASE